MPEACFATTRVFIFLPVFRGFLFPILGRLSSLDLLVLVTRIVLLRSLDDGGVVVETRLRHDDLPAACDEALRFQVLLEEVEQRVDLARLHQRLAEQPDRRRIRHGMVQVRRFEVL